MSFTALSHSVLPDGQDVALFPTPSELTVAQAAKFLRSSEGYLNEVLNAGYIAFRLENGERMVQLNSMLEYEQEQERRHAAFDEFVHMNQEMGLYDD